MYVYSKAVSYFHQLHHYIRVEKKLDLIDIQVDRQDCFFPLSLLDNIVFVLVPCCAEMKYRNGRLNKVFFISFFLSFFLAEVNERLFFSILTLFFSFSILF